MNRVRRSFVLSTFLLVVLAACTQVAPTPAAQLELDPLAFGSSGFDAAYGLAKHSTGTYAVGYTGGNLHATQIGAGDAFVRKYDAFGSVIWGRQFGTAQYEFAEGVASDGGNNAYVVGTTEGSLAGSRGNYDIFLRKYSASGGTSAGVWTRQFGSTGSDQSGDVAVVGSNVYVAGTVANPSTSDYNAYLAKYNTSGRLLWTRSFGTSAQDAAYDVAVDGSGNAYVVGFTSGSFPGFTNGGGPDMFIRRYNANGSVAWTRQYHYSNNDTARAVTVSGSNVYLVGEYDYANNYADSDIAIIKLTTSGGVSWSTTYSPTTDQFVTDVSFNGGLYVSGHEYTSGFTDANGVVLKYSGAGGFVWAKTQATSSFDYSYAVLARSSSEVYVAGSTYGVLGGGNSGSGDGFLRRLNGTNGNTVWTDQ